MTGWNPGDGQKHLYESRIHLNNIRHDAKLAQNGNQLHYYHPLAEMSIVTGCDSNNVNRVGRSFVCSDLYNKFDIRQDDERKKGNAIQLIYGDPKPQQKNIIFAAMRLSRPGENKKVSASYKNGVLSVENATVRLLPNGVSVVSGGVTEDFTYTKKK